MAFDHFIYLSSAACGYVFSFQVAVEHLPVCIGLTAQKRIALHFCDVVINAATISIL